MTSFASYERDVVYLLVDTLDNNRAIVSTERTEFTCRHVPGNRLVTNERGELETSTARLETSTSVSIAVGNRIEVDSVERLVIKVNTQKHFRASHKEVFLR